MDVVVHAIVGAGTGAAFGRPILGAVVAILPDMPLWFRRRQAKPPYAYALLHSGPMLAYMAVLFGLAWGIFGLAWQTPVVVWLAWASHVAIDIPTHAKLWQPKLLWPSEWVVFPQAQEWEFFNGAWWFGLLISSLWLVVMVCLSALLQ